MPENAPPDPADAPGRDALARARDTRVVVVGGGVAGLVAALEWAKIGAAVTVLEASDRFGGSIETALLDGMPVDLVADAYPIGAPELGALIDDLDLRELVEPAAAHPVWISGPAGPVDRSAGGGGAAPLPQATVLGIPANPWATDVRRIIGWRGAWRAYLDRLRPPLTIGHERSLGRLVRVRMGDRVADRLVAPVTRGLYGVEADLIDVEVAAPGLSTALTRTGSLAGAAFDLLPEDPGAPTRATLRGGLGILISALLERLTGLGADLRGGARAIALSRTGDWEVAVEVISGERAEDAEAPGADIAEPGEALRADVVIVATSGDDASALLTTAGVDIAPAGATARDIVTIVVDAPELDSAPRGRAVFPISSDAPAVAASLATADWPWLAQVAGSGRHVVRVTLTADAARSDDAVIADAVRAADALLAVTLPVPRAAERRTVTLAPPASALDHEKRAAATRATVARHTGLAVVGAAISGSGIAQVVADAVAEMDRMRSAVIWPDEEGGEEGREAAPTATG